MTTGTAREDSLQCARLGHRWHFVVATGDSSRRDAYYLCLRCRTTDCRSYLWMPADSVTAL